MKLLCHGTVPEHFLRCADARVPEEGLGGWLEKIAQVTPSLGRCADRPRVGREKRHIDMLLWVCPNLPFVV